MKAPKFHKCKACGGEFQRRNSMQKACSPECALALVNKAKVKAAAEETKAKARDAKAKIKAMKTLPELRKEAQAAFNAYIRARDAGKPCISCGCPLPSGGVGGGFDAGHYRTRGAAPHLAFDEDNAHGQCKRCNRYLAGNAADYRIGLIERIGMGKVEALEANNETAKFTKEQLESIKNEYKQKFCLIRRENEVK